MCLTKGQMTYEALQKSGSLPRMLSYVQDRLRQLEHQHNEYKTQGKILTCKWDYLVATEVQGAPKIKSVI